MTPKSSRDLAGRKPRHDSERDDEKARIVDAEKTGVANRDRVHGDGSKINLDGD